MKNWQRPSLLTLPLIYALLLLSVVAQRSPAPDAQVVPYATTGYVESRLLAQDPALLETLRSLVASGGVAAALKHVAALAAQDKQVSKDLHEIEHAIGGYSVLVGNDLSREFRDCLRDLSEGCQHGLAQQALWLERDRSPASGARLCEKLAGRESSEFTGCAHSVAHGAAPLLNYDITALLTFCDAFTLAAQPSCGVGAFMTVQDHMMNSYDAGSRKTIDESQALAFCKDIPSHYLPVCHTIQGSLFFYISDANIAKTAGYCRQISQNYQNGCFEEIGRILINREGAPDISLAGCTQVSNPSKPAERDNCLLGIASVDEVSYTWWPPICRSMSGEEQALCWVHQASRIIKQTTPGSVRTGACTEIDLAQSRTRCLEVKL